MLAAQHDDDEEEEAYTWVSQKFCNIYSRSSSWRVYDITKSVQTMKNT